MNIAGATVGGGASTSHDFYYTSFRPMEGTLRQGMKSSQKWITEDQLKLSHMELGSP